MSGRKRYNPCAANIPLPTSISMPGMKWQTAPSSGITPRYGRKPNTWSRDEKMYRATYPYRSKRASRVLILFNWASIRDNSMAVSFRGSWEILTIALLGHAVTQDMHSSHSSRDISAFPDSTVIAPLGQAFTHSPQPRHSSFLTSIISRALSCIGTLKCARSRHYTCPG